MGKGRSPSGGRDRCVDVTCQELDVPAHSRSHGSQEQSILATSQAISRRWGSDGRMDEWHSSDCEGPHRHPAATGAATGYRPRRRMSDVGRMTEWSTSTQPSSEKSERLCHTCWFLQLVYSDSI